MVRRSRRSRGKATLGSFAGCAAVVAGWVVRGSGARTPDGSRVNRFEKHLPSGAHRPSSRGADVTEAVALRCLGGICLAAGSVRHARRANGSEPNSVFSRWYGCDRCSSQPGRTSHSASRFARRLRRVSAEKRRASANRARFGIGIRRARFRQRKEKRWCSLAALGRKRLVGQRGDACLGWRCGDRHEAGVRDGPG